MTDILDIDFFDNDFYKLIFKFVLNFIVITIIARGIYYPIAKRKDYLFSYYLISFVVFSICFTLKKIDLQLGMALGLFAIFGILRYRTDAMPIKEMTYLFVIIGISVVNSLSSRKTSLAEILFVNASIIVITYVLERVWLLKHKTYKLITYEKIDLIVPDKYQELKADLEKRTGLVIEDIEVGPVNFLNDTAQITISYFENKK